jgi:hypothetical protein
MVTREIRTSLDSDLYIELMSAMMEHRQYEGGYIMQYSEHLDSELRMVGVFFLREEERSSS